MPRRKSVKPVKPVKPVPALVYSPPESPLQCELFTKSLSEEMSLTFYLRFRVQIRESDEEQEISFQYDADGLVPDTCMLLPVNIALPASQVNRLAQQGQPDLKTLCLTLKDRCHVWCSKSLESITPRPESAASFSQLASLARGEEVNIVFDYKCFRGERRARLNHLIQHIEMKGVGTTRPNRGYRLLDLTIFGAVEEVESDDLPPYTATAKRGRESSSGLDPRGSLPTTPPSKRACRSPIYDFTPSSDQKTIVLTRPRTLDASATSISKFEHAMHILESRVTRILPEVLEMLSTVPSSPAPSGLPVPSIDETSVPVRPSPKLSDLGGLLAQRFADHIEKRIDSIYDKTLGYAAYIRDEADMKFHEEVDEKVLDIRFEKECIDQELNSMVAAKLEEFQMGVEDILDEKERAWIKIAETASEVCTQVQEECQRLETKQKEFKGLKEMLERMLKETLQGAMRQYDNVETGNVKEGVDVDSDATTEDEGPIDSPCTALTRRTPLSMTGSKIHLSPSQHDEPINPVKQDTIAAAQNRGHAPAIPSSQAQGAMHDTVTRFRSGVPQAALLAQRRRSV